MNQEDEVALATEETSMRWPTRTPVWLVFLGVLMAAGCGSQGVVDDSAAGGHASVSIPLSKIAAAAIASGDVVVSAADMADLVQPLTVSGSLMTGVVSGISAGNARLFTLNGYDASGVLTYTGSSSADVVAGERVRVEVTLRPLTQSSEAGLVLRGTPQITQGRKVSLTEWDTFSGGEDARVTGEIENGGTTAARDVRVTVSLRDLDGNLLGRVRDQAVTRIEPGESEQFVVILTSVFSENNIDTAAYTAEVEIAVPESIEPLLLLPTFLRLWSSYRTTFTLEIENVSGSQITGVEISGRARNAQGAGLSDAITTIGTLAPGKSVLFELRFSNSDYSQTDSNYIVSFEYTIRADGLDDVSGAYATP